MKNLCLLLSFLYACTAFGQAGKTVINVQAPEGCLVAMITAEEAGDSEYGWWNVWHEKKNANQVFPNKYSFPPASYDEPVTLVVYWPDGQIGGSPEADGIVLENIQFERYVRRVNYRFTKADFTEWNCLSCPWLCVYNGQEYVKQEEVIKDVVGYERKQTTHSTISPTAVIDGKLRIQIREEKDETSFLDQVILKAGDQIIYANANEASLNAIDDSYLTLTKGENIELEFDVPQGFAGELSIQVNGYYEPNPGFMEEITAKLLSR